MKDLMVNESVKIKKSTKIQLKNEAAKRGISKSEYERMKLESPLQPREMQKRERIRERQLIIDHDNKIMDYIKYKNLDEKVNMLLQSLLLYSDFVKDSF